MEQHSAEWYAARLGRVTASRIADVMAMTKSGPGAARGNYMAELIAERLTGAAAERFTNAAMQHGTDTEPEARGAYEMATGLDVQEVGFIDHPSIDMTGASPDGVVGDDGLIEIKCPNTATHIATLRGGKVARKYMMQMQWQLACTDRKWCDFVSYDNRLPGELSIIIKRVERDDDLISDIETAVSDFLAEMDAVISDLRQRAAA